MKTIKKIASLTLLTVCLQGDASAANPNLFQTGPDGFIATCQFQGGRLSGPLKNRFQQTYGIGSDVCTPINIQAVQDIQAFIADPTKFDATTTPPTFADDDAVQEFVRDFGGYGNLLKNPNIFPTNYLAIAEDWLEAKVKSEATQSAALKDIATGLLPLTGGTVPPVLSEKRIKTIAKQVVESEAEEKDARLLLNSLTLQWNPGKTGRGGAVITPAGFAAAPASLTNSGGKAKFPKAVYESVLNEYIEETFARRLQSLVPVATPSFATLLPLIQDPATPLVTDLLNPVTTPQPANYVATEAQLVPVLTAMTKQIHDTNAELDKIRGVAGAIPPGPLSVKMDYILKHMRGAVISAKDAVSAALSPIAGLVGYTIPPVVAPATAPVIDEVALSTHAAAAITATEAQLDRVAKLNPIYAFTAAQTTLPQRTTALLTHLSGHLTAALADNTATDAELVRVAGTLKPAFALAAGNLPTRAAALLTHLSSSGGSAGIDAYLGGNLADNLYTALESSIKATRTAVAVAASKKKTNIVPLNDIVMGLQADPTYKAATTAEAKVKAAITYLTGQLYTSYMWLTKIQDGTAAAPVAILGVPPYASGNAQDVAAAAQNRITALLNAIKTLHADNTRLEAAVRSGGGLTITADTDAHVIAAATTAQGLNTKLSLCAGLVTPGTTPKVDLTKFDTAVSNMVAALTDLSSGVTGAAAATGTDLAKAIRDAITASNTAGLAASIDANITTVNDTLSGMVNLPALPPTKKLIALNDNAILLAGILQELAYQAGIKDGSGAAIQAVKARAPLMLATAAKLNPATLTANITKNLMEGGVESFVNELLDAAAVRTWPAFFNIDDLHITGIKQSTADAEVAGLLCRNSMMFVRDVVADTGVTPTPAADWADFAALDAAVKAKIAQLKAAAAKPAVSTGKTQADIDAAVLAAKKPLEQQVRDLTQELGKAPQDIANELASNTAGTGYGFAAIPGYNLATLTADAPKAGSDIKVVGDYLRQCALAANLLKVEAGITTIPATLQDLMTQAAAKIKAFKSVAPAAPAPAAAAIPAAAIAGHNASVAFVVAQFNASGAAFKQTSFTTLIPALNAAAAALGAGAQTITIKNPNGDVINMSDKTSRGTIVGVKSPTKPDATNSTWATAA